MALGVAREELGQDIGADAGRGTDGELADHPRRQLGDQRRTTTQRFQGPLRIGQEGAARVRQLHARPRAPEERRAELRLEPLDAGGERRLADVQQLRGASQVALAGDGDEPLDLRVEHPRIIASSDRLRGRSDRRLRSHGRLGPAARTCVHQMLTG